MILKNITVLVILVIVSSSMYPAYAAQLDASIAKNSLEFEPTFQFTRVITIQYDEDSTLAKLVGDKQQKIRFDINSENSKFLVDLINKELEEKSFVKVSDVSGKYSAVITPRAESLGIEYHIVLRPVMSGHFIEDVSTLDSQWRGFSITDEIPMMQFQLDPLVRIIGSLWYDINSPKSVIDETLPQVIKYLSGSDAMNILDIPLVDASGISELPLSKWESMFDPTAVMSERERYGFSGSVLTTYSMGICTIFRGICQDKIISEDFVINGEQYSITSIESQDDATIILEGYVQEEYLGQIEIFTILANAPSKRSGSNNQVSIIYVMAGVAAIVAVGFFVWSSKKTKNTPTEQTGVDPKDLRFDAIGNHAGSYRTNRGTASLN